MMPIAIYPVIALGTLGLNQCNTGVNARMSSAQYSVRSMSIGEMSAGGGNNICSFKSKLKDINISEPNKKKITDYVFGKNISPADKDLIINALDKYKYTDGLGVLISDLGITGKRPSVFQTLRYAEKFDPKQLKFEQKGNGYDIDLAVYDGNQLDKAIQFKTSGIQKGSNPFSALKNKLDTGELKQLDNVTDAKERIVSIDSPNGQFDQQTKDMIEEKLPIIFKKTKLDTLEINIGSVSRRWFRSDY